jgi:hypothetical protein
MAEFYYYITLDKKTYLLENYIANRFIKISIKNNVLKQGSLPKDKFLRLINNMYKSRSNCIRNIAIFFVEKSI